MEPSLDSRLAIPESVRFREVGGELVLLDLESSRYFALDQVGTSMWMELAEHGSPRRTKEAMMRLYEVEPEQLEQDLLGLLKQLMREGLVRIEDETPEKNLQPLAR